jgi:hypothetical protein
MSRYASINVGYGYEVGNYGLQTLQKIETQNVDLGIEYRRPLTRSRRTTFGFTTGAALLSAQPHRQWQALGTANLRHEFNRGWFIQGDFGRSVQLVEGFTAPFLVNTVTASVGGFMGRRVELVSSGGYSSGVVGFGSDRYHAVQGSARLRLALARYVAIDTEGLTNQYLFNNRIAVPTSLPPQLNRWAVRCSVALWLPLAR